MHEKLEMIRGDTLNLKFQRKTENQEVIFENVDEMFMTFKKNRETKKSLIQKRLNHGITYDSETGYYHVVINPEDTDNLSYGKYYFDVEITKNNIVKTILLGTLQINKEVTFTCNKEDS